MNDKLSPLDQDIASLLQSERDAPGGGPSADAHGRVAGRLAASLGIPLLVPGGPFTPDGPPPDGSPSGGPPDGPGADPSGVDPSGVDPSGMDPSGLDLSSAADASALLDPSLADPALAAAAKAVAVSTAGKAAGAAAGVSTAAGAGAAAGTGAAAGAGAASGAAAGTAIAAAGTAAGASAGAAAGAGASAAAGAGVMALITKPLLLGTFVAGTMVGGGTVAVVQPAIAPEPKPKIVYVPQPTNALSSNLAEAAFADDDELDAEAAVAEEPEPPKATRPKRKRPPKKVAKAVVGAPVEKASKAERDAALAKENALVQMARTSLQRQKHAQALQALRDHKRNFPSGKLAEEREALTIFSLIGLGEVNAAKAAARRFGVRYPKSIFATPVKQALRGR